MQDKAENYLYEYRLLRKSSLRYILPATLTVLCGQLAPIVDSICISRGLGDIPLSATSVAIPIIYIFNVIGALGGIGCGITVSKCSGSGQKKKAARVFTSAFFFMVVVTLLLDILIFLFMDQILHIFGATNENLLFAREYLSVILLGSVFISLMFAGDYILTDDNNPRLALIGNIVAVAVNVVIDITGIFVFHLGIWVTAFGTVFSMFCCCMVYIAHFRQKDSLCHFALKKSKTEKISPAEYLKPGIPQATMYVLMITTMLLQNNVLKDAGGTSGLGNAAIIENLELIMMFFIAGICEVVMPIASAFFGEKNLSCVLMAKKFLLRLGLFVILPVVIIISVFPQIFLAVYSVTDETMITTLPSAIRLIALATVFLLTNSLIVDYLSAVNQEKNATISYVVQFVFDILTLWLVSHIDEINAPWYADLVSQFAVTVFLLLICGNKKGLIKNHKENTLLMDGGFANHEQIIRWQNKAKEVLTEMQANKVWEKVLNPFEKALPEEKAPLCAFTILDKGDDNRAVILRYDSKKDYLGEDDNKSEEENLFDVCIRSEFNSMRRMMINLQG